MATYRTEGIILKRSNFGEGDKILTVLTRQHGKLKVLAKGVRKISSRRAGSVELFNHSVLFLYSGKTFDLLTEARPLSTFPRLRRNLAKVAVAFYLVELVDKLLPEKQENRLAFALLRRNLERLEKEKVEKWGKFLEDFESSLLQLTGFRARERSRPLPPYLFIENLLGRKLRGRRFLATLLRGEKAR